MVNISQWRIALFIGIPISACFNRSGSAFRNGFDEKTQKNKK